MITRNRKPTTPNEILRDLYLDSRNIDTEEFIDVLGKALKDCELARKIVLESEPISVKAAIVLAALLGTTIELWINLQIACENYSLRYTVPEKTFKYEPDYQLD